MCVRPARCDQGPSLFADGSDQLPEPADLFYHPSPKEGSGLFSLRSQANGISAPGQVRKRRRCARPVLAERPQSERLYTGDVAWAGGN